MCSAGPVGTDLLGSPLFLVQILQHWDIGTLRQFTNLHRGPFTLVNLLITGQSHQMDR